jgi:hypothetical protein
MHLCCHHQLLARPVIPRGHSGVDAEYEVVGLAGVFVVSHFSHLVHICLGFYIQDRGICLYSGSRYLIRLLTMGGIG